MQLTKTRAAVVLTAIALLSALSLSGAVSAAPAPLTTPSQPSWAAAKAVAFSSGQQITANGRLSTIALPLHGALDLQYIVDGAGGANPFTLTLEYSNDGSNWVRASASAWSNTAATTATTDMTRTYLFGSFVTAYISVTNATPITLTVLGLAK